MKSNAYCYVYGYVMTYEVRNVTFYNMPNRFDKIYFKREIYFAKKTHMNIT